MSKTRLEDIKNAGIKSRNAMAWLRDHQLPAEPICYTIAYEYLFTDSNSLKAEIDKLDLTSEDYRKKLDDVFKNSIMSKQNQKLGMFGDHDDKYVCEILNLLINNYDNKKDISSAVNQLKDMMNIVNSKQDSDFDNEHPEENYLVIRDKSSIDELTSALDLNGLKRTLAEAAQVDELFPMSVIRIDIDKFKHINDTNGSFMGDNVLKHLAKLFKRSTKGGDIVSRLEEDEFIIVLPKTPLKNGIVVAENLRKKVMALSLKKKGNTNVVKLTVSAGVSQYNKDSDFEEILQKCKIALNRSKDLGRNSVNSDQ
ncbi:GGDEF domain-containing protein [Aliikangiella sp. IMCC44359]|uniref:GGDEF domain-containing protein n=1 Tax=Aliikangiella sp. IMCC44359 TaxID=3459125 RepID=UPI00403ABFB4